MTHPTPPKDAELRQYCVDFLLPWEGYEEKHLFTPQREQIAIVRALLDRLNHADILAEIERRNKAGETIRLHYSPINNQYAFANDGYEILATYDFSPRARGTITDAWTAFCELEVK